VEFDVVRDDWGQLRRIPGVIEILGAPTPLPEGQLEELISRLPTHLERTADDAVIPVGAEMRITAGAFSGRVGKVTSSRRGRVKVLLMMFGHLREQELYVADVKVIN
jgi:transcription antitermination factor NusG